MDFVRNKKSLSLFLHGKLQAEAISKSQLRISITLTGGTRKSVKKYTLILKNYISKGKFKVLKEKKQQDLFPVHLHHSAKWNKMKNCSGLELYMLNRFCEFLLYYSNGHLQNIVPTSPFITLLQLFFANDQMRISHKR